MVDVAAAEACPQRPGIDAGIFRPAVCGDNQVQAFKDLLGDLYAVVSGQAMIQNGEIKRLVQGDSRPGSQGDIDNLPVDIFQYIPAALTGKAYIGGYDPFVGRV